MNLKTIATPPLGNVQAFELDTVFKAMYAVKNPLKMYKLDTQMQKIKYTVEVEKNKVLLGRRCVKVLRDEDYKKLKRRHIQVIDDETSVDDVDRSCKHIYRKDNKWYAIVINKNGGKPEEKVVFNDRLEEAFIKHVITQFNPQNMTKLAKDWDVVRTWITSFLAKKEHNAEYIAMYEKEMLENAKKIYYETYRDKHKRKKDVDVYDSPHFQKWYKRTVMMGGAGNIHECLKKLCYKKRSPDSGEDSEESTKRTCSGILDMKFSQETLDRSMSSNSQGSQGSQVSQVSQESQESRICSNPTDTFFNIFPTIIPTLSVDECQLYKYLPLIHLFYDNMRTFDIVHAASTSTPAAAAASSGGAADDDYNEHRLAADLQHDFGFDLKNINNKLDLRKYKSEDKFVKYAITQALKKNPQMIYDFHLTSADEWVHQTNCLINIVFQGNNNFVIDGAIPVSGIIKPENGIQKHISYGHWIDPFSPSLPSITLSYDDNAMTHLNTVFNNFFKPYFPDISFSFKYENDKLSFTVKTLTVEIIPQLFSINNIDNYFLNYIDEPIHSIYKNLTNLVPKNKKELFLRMFKEVGDHVQLHELIQHRDSPAESSPPTLTIESAESSPLPPHNVNFGTQDRVLYADAIYQYGMKESGKAPNIFFPIESFHAKFEDEDINMILDINYLNNDGEKDGENTNDISKYIMCVSSDIVRIPNEEKEKIYLLNKVKALHYRYSSQEMFINQSVKNFLNIGDGTDDTNKLKNIEANCNNFVNYILKNNLQPPTQPLFNVPKLCILLDMIFGKLEEIHLFNNNTKYAEQLEQYIKTFKEIKTKIETAMEKKSGSFVKRISRRLAGKTEDNIKQTFEEMLLKYNYHTNKQINVLDIAEMAGMTPDQNTLYYHMKGMIKIDNTQTEAVNVKITEIITLLTEMSKKGMGI